MKARRSCYAGATATVDSEVLVALNAAKHLDRHARGTYTTSRGRRSAPRRTMIRAALAITIVTLAGACAACAGRASAQTATVEIRYSHFNAGDITARVGRPITITLRNDDPIEHEWIVGTEAVHERHRTGTEAYHGDIPTEVTIPAYSTRVTRIVFHEPGDYKYICHLPNHEQYGMVGVLHVVN